MLWIVLSLACVHSTEVPTPEPELSSPSSSTVSAPPKTPNGENAPGLQPSTEVSLDTIDECIEICVQQNQMRAVSADVIESDCRASCSSESQPFGPPPLAPPPNSD